LPGQVVDLLDLQAQLGVDTGLQIGELLAGAGKARRHLLRAAQHHLARRRVGGPAGDVDQGVQELVGGVAQAALAGREDLLQAQQVVAQRTVTLCLGTRAVGLGGHEAVVGAQHGVDVDPLADETRAAELRHGGGQQGALARVAGCVGVGDVVADHAQCRLVGEHGAGADVQQVSHAITPSERLSAARARQARARWTRSVVLITRPSLLAYSGSVA
jgi:hypothetical protein